MTLQEGSTLGPYRLLRRLGRGGAGEVYLAEGIANPNTSVEWLAVKVIAGTAADPTAQSIVREAQAAGRLQQPHIIPLYGVIEDGDRLATVMAFARGGSLGDNLRATGADGQPRLALPLSPAIVARLVSQVAAALDAAHMAGLAHGDLKPNNVFVRTSPSGHPLAAVSDFGQSVLMSASVAILASANTPGTSSGEQSAWAASQLLFAAPEQLNGITMPATDQYGLAALAYLLLTGTPPIVGNGMSMLQLISQNSITPPSRFNSHLSPAVDQALLRGLARDPSQRFPSLVIFAQTLRGALAPLGGTGVTDQFSMLSDSDSDSAETRDSGGPYSSSSSGTSGINLARATATSPGEGSRLAHSADKSGAIPDPSPTINKRLAIITCVALLLSIFACVLAGQAFGATSLLPHITLGNQPQGIYTPIIPTPDATAQALAGLARQDLLIATAQNAVFRDPLTKNNNNWPTDGTSLYFAHDGYHISTFSASSTLESVDTPVNQGHFTNLVVQVSMRFTEGQVGDFAGLRFFVSQNSGGSEDYYCFLASIEGRYAVWEHRGVGQLAWTFITSGYSNTLNTGLHQTNVLAVLAIGSGSHQRVLFFANHRYITELPLTEGSIAPSSGTGLIVFNDDTQAVFTNISIYDASKAS